MTDVIASEHRQIDGRSAHPHILRGRYVRRVVADLFDGDTIRGGHGAVRGGLSMDNDSGPSTSDRFKQWLMPRMTGPHVWVYRRFDGKYGNRTDAGGPVLLLTTTGRRTGSKRTVALGFLDSEDSWLVVGSNGGRPQEPAWALNLRANPVADVQVGPDKFEVTTDLLEGDQRNVQWNAFVDAYPEYEQAESWSGRRFPLFRLPKPGLIDEIRRSSPRQQGVGAPETA